MTDTPAAQANETRSIVVEKEVAAPPDEVWEALTTPDGLTQWFPLNARVEPGVGGSIWISWGPGSEGEAEIHAWDRPRRFGWTESYGADESGRPIQVAVDFHVEGRDGTTVVRLVQSGLSAAAEWDEMYDALEDGWTYFMFNLAFYLLKHRNERRTLVWRRVATELGREAVWERLVGGALVAAAVGPGADAALTLDQPRDAEVVSVREGRHFAATIPDLDDSVLFVEIEGRHVGFWLSTYGMDSERTDALQAALDARVEAALGGGGEGDGGAESDTGD